MQRHKSRLSLASATIQIRQEPGEQPPTHLQRECAPRWTEDFLQTARAQMQSRENFVELEITALRHEAVDEIDPLAQKQQLSLEISVPDQGLGIAAQDPARLFKRFSRPNGKGQHTGAGLGLYFVQTVLHHHGSAVHYSRLSEQTCIESCLPSMHWPLHTIKS